MLTEMTLAYAYRYGMIADFTRVMRADMKCLQI